MGFEHRFESLRPPAGVRRPHDGGGRARRAPRPERLLLIRSLDDLKDRLAKVMLLILVVKFFEYALGLPVTGPLDLLYLAIGIVAVAAALALTHKGNGHRPAAGVHGDGHAG